MEQRSPEWFEWRNEGIGSSEASVLMGFNKYQTVHQLWLEKTKKVQRQFTTSFLAERGTRLEDYARKCYEKFSGNIVKDALFEHPKYSFVRASLDGWNEENKLILEIKCPTAKNQYRAVVEDWIKPEYYCQIQHQYIASKALRADYWSFDGKCGHLIKVNPDPWFMGELLERELTFWECVKKDTPPDPENFKQP